MKLIFDNIFNILSNYSLLIPLLMVMVYVMMDVFRQNPEVHHTSAFKLRRVINWLPLGLTYAFLYMARYNLTVAKTALGNGLMSKEQFGVIFGTGALVYGFSFLINGPLTDKIGGKATIIISAVGAAIANVLMGVFLYGKLIKGWALDLTFAFVMLYALNMYFQSFGAVAIVKVNAAWFHVRERGVFGGIFGILISLGLFLAYDPSNLIVDATKSVVDPTKLSGLQMSLRSLLSVEGSPVDQTWWVFFVPATVLIIFAFLDWLIIRDAPSGAGFKDFYLADASSGEEDKPFRLGEILKKIITNKIILTIAFIEFCTGVLRQSVMQWYPIFRKEIPDIAAKSGRIINQNILDFMGKHWGLILMFAGVFGGMIAGWVSDRVFKSRRGPVAALLYGLMFISAIIMIFTVKGNQLYLAIAAVALSFAVIGTHGMLSGTSTMDFGGRRAAGTAVGLIDGFVYFGTSLQGFCLGYITTRDWSYWPVFMIPFTVIGLILAMRIWKAIPIPKAAPVMAVKPGSDLVGGEVPEAE